jgi:hypothetical protein
MLASLQARKEMAGYILIYKEDKNEGHQIVEK